MDPCDYDVIDFSTRSDKSFTKTGESLSSLEYEAYGMMIEAISVPAPDSPESAKLGRAYLYNSTDDRAGMVLIVPAHSNASTMS